MLKSPRVHPIIGMLRLAGAIAIVCLGSLLSAHGQQQWIDCTGTMTPSNNITVYSGFQDYLNKVGPTGTVYVNGPCPGNFTIWGGDNFYIIGPAVINGNIGVGHSENAVFLRYLTITNSSGDGLDVSGSKVSLDSCSVSNNAGNGVSVDNSSHVVVVGTGVFDNNGGWAGGFHIDGHSFLNIAPSGAVEIRGNSGSGIWATQADIQINGDTDISANINGPGIELLGGARAQVGDSNGTPNLIENNPNGGIDVRENSELSLFTCCSNPPDLVRNNVLF